MILRPLASSSRGNACLVRAQGRALLIEAGLPVRELRRRLVTAGSGLGQVDACLLTHEHADHARGAADLLRAGVPVWCSSGTGLSLGISGWRRLVEHQPVEVAGFVVRPLPATHDAAEPMALIVDGECDRLLLATDTGWLPEPHDVGPVTILAVEANHCADLLPAEMLPGERWRLQSTHLSLERLLEWLPRADLSRCREIWLLHLSRRHSDAERMRAAVQAATGCPVWVAEE